MSESDVPQYKPAIPLQVTARSVLSQDLISTTAIPVDAASLSPVGAFQNKHNGGKAEALAIVNTGRGRQLCHITQSDAGWSAKPLFDGCEADQVTACTAYAGTSAETVHGLYLHDAAIHITSLDGGTGEWSKPQVIAGLKIPNPRVAYSPGGRAVIHGADDQGNLVVAYQDMVGGPFKSKRCTTALLKGGDYQLTMTGEEDWRILANVSGKAYVLSGTLSGATPSSSAPAPGLSETISQVVLGYWSTNQNTVIFLFVASDHALHAWSQAGLDDPAVERIPNSSVVRATGYIDESGLLHVYALDASNWLWVLHQSTRRPFNDDGTPNWAPILPLDRGVARLASDMNPTSSPVLFAVDGGDATLRLHEVDQESKLWRSTPVTQATEQAYEVTRFRTEIVVRDARGMPLPNCEVKLQVKPGESAVDVSAGGARHTIDRDGKTLKTDVMGKLTLSSLASNGLACSNLIVTRDHLPEPVAINPAKETHEYLAGRGTLNPSNPDGPLAVFDADGKTLAAARVKGQTLAPNAADAQVAKLAADAIRTSAMVATGTAPPTLTGFAGSFDAGKPHFRAFHSQDELQAYRLSSGWGDLQASANLGSFFGDIWEGIKNGVIAIGKFFVDLKNKAVELVVKIGEWISEKIHLAMDTLEKVAHFIAGVFEWVGAQVRKVVDWLKALFDFKAIWNTKMALEEAILSMPGYVARQVGGMQRKADDWFAAQRKDIALAFDQQIAQYEGNDTRFGDSPNWQPVDGSAGKPFAGEESARDSRDNPHHNWLQDKIAAHAPSYTADNDYESAWLAFCEHLEEAGQDVSAALEDFRQSMKTLIEHPEQFGSLGIAWLLRGVRDLVDAALLTADAMVDGLLSIMQHTMKALEALLTAELPLGPLNALWEWMADQAGHPEDGKLTMAALVSLFTAFPTTIIYKLIHGVNEQPFPTGKLPVIRTGRLGITMPKVCREISCLVLMLSCSPNLLADVLGPASPGWLSAITIGMAAAVWILANGYPEVSALTWSTLKTTAPLAMAVLGWIAYVLKGVILAAVKWLLARKDDAIAVGLTVVGVLQLGVGVYHNWFSDSPPPLGVKIANIVVPLSSLFAFLGLTPIRNTPIYGQVAIAAKAGLINFVSYVGGGAELFIAVSKSPALVEAIA